MYRWWSLPPASARLEAPVAELTFDYPVPELTEEEDAQTLAAIEQGVAQPTAGQGIPLEEVRREFVRRCLK
jgi:hypothetical protein